jgi:hypothetical protein
VLVGLVSPLAQIQATHVPARATPGLLRDVNMINCSVAVEAFFAYFLFCVFTFVKGSRRAINKFARFTFDRRKYEAAELGETFNELAGWFEATQIGGEGCRGADASKLSFPLGGPTEFSVSRT